MIVEEPPLDWWCSVTSHLSHTTAFVDDDLLCWWSSGFQRGPFPSLEPENLRTDIAKGDFGEMVLGNPVGPRSLHGSLEDRRGSQARLRDEKTLSGLAK